MKFIDKVSIILSSGKGGPGCASFSREAFRPRGGPDGGDGGRGGDVIFKVNPDMTTLFHLKGKRRLSARNGDPGRGQKSSGSAGEPLIVEIPAGTVVKDPEGRTLADLLDGERLFLQGGKGGLGNFHFKNSQHQAPTYFQPGLEGEEKAITLELRMIADVGVIGFPNAGKSTLVSAMTAAKTKIADYPFTTLQPQLGVVELENGRGFTMADIPGLIEGAAEGQGLGHEFLQHIKRTKMFIHLLDASDFSQRNVFDDYQKINLELKKYDDLKTTDPDEVQLSERKQVVVINKWDAASEDRVEDIEAQFAQAKVPLIKISAVAKKNIDKLITKICDVLKEVPNG